MFRWSGCIQYSSENIFLVKVTKISLTLETSWNLYVVAGDPEAGRRKDLTPDLVEACTTYSSVEPSEILTVYVIFFSLL